MLDISYYEPYYCCYKGQAGPNQYEIYKCSLFCEVICFLVSLVLIVCAVFAEFDVSGGAVTFNAEFVVFHCLLLSSDNNIIQYGVLVCQVLLGAEKKRAPVGALYYMGGSSKSGVSSASADTGGSQAMF